MVLIKFLNQRSKLSIILIGLGLVFVLGVYDAVTGPELSSALFYLAPIFVVTWYAGKWPGILFSILSAAI